MLNNNTTTTNNNTVSVNAVSATAAKTKTPAPSAPSAPKKPVKQPKPSVKESFRRGLKKAEAVSIIENFNFPKEPFTLSEICEKTGICHWYLIEFVKKNGKIVGDSSKRPGARGKAAKLYQITLGS